MQSVLTSNTIPTKYAELRKTEREMTGKNNFHAVCFPLVPLDRKISENFLFSVNTKNISSHVLKISEISFVLRTREFTDVFLSFDEIYLVITS